MSKVIAYRVDFRCRTRHDNATSLITMSPEDACLSRMKTALTEHFGEGTPAWEAEVDRIEEDGDAIVAEAILLQRLRRKGATGGDAMLNPALPEVLGELEAEWLQCLQSSGTIRSWSVVNFGSVSQDRAKLIPSLAS